MSEIITVGLDLAKNVFQAQGADASGRTVLVRVALANKMARIAWALMTREEVYHPKAPVTAAARAAAGTVNLLAEERQGWNAADPTRRPRYQ